MEIFLEKSFELYYQEDNTMEVKKENTDPEEVPELKNPEDSVEFVPDKLLVQLHSLHIAENAPDSSSDNEEGNNEDEDVSLILVIIIMVKVLFL